LFYRCIVGIASFLTFSGSRIIKKEAKENPEKLRELC